MKITLTNLKKINTLEELNLLDMGKAFYDIGYRGGHLGFRGIDVANRLGINYSNIPTSFGAYCNYLGGGIRGALVVSDFNVNVKGRKKQLLEAVGEACKRVYLNLEGDSGLNDEYDEHTGEPNWETMGTNRARLKGIVSGY